MFHRHHRGRFLTFLIALLGVILLFIFLGIAEEVFQKIGFTRSEFAIILVATLLGSFVNIPLYRVKGVQRVVNIEEVKVFWITYRIPRYSLRKVSTTVALNVGGAIVPVLVSAYVLYMHPQIWLPTFIGILFTSLIVHFVAREVSGVGIVTPAFIPPLTAAIIAVLVSGTYPAMIAYVSGTLGALIGADLTNLRGLTKLGAHVASIGGAGTFDGVFLTGIVAVILVLLI